MPQEAPSVQSRIAAARMRRRIAQARRGPGPAPVPEAPSAAPETSGVVGRVRDFLLSPAPGTGRLPERRLPGIVEEGPGAGRLVQPGELEATEAARVAREHTPPRTQFGRGLRTGLLSARAGVGEAVETVGGLADRPGLVDLGEAVSTDARRRQEIVAPRVSDYREIKSLGDFGDWAAFQVGQGLGSTAAPVAGAVAGGLAAGPGGAVAGALGPSYTMLLGEVRGELEEADVDPSTIDALAPIAAVPAAALEAVLPGLIGRRLSHGVAATFGRDLVRRLAARAAQGALIEGLTEAGQEAISIATTAGASPDREFMEGETFHRMVNAALAGALPGAAFGAAGGAVEGRVAPPQAEPTVTPGRGVFDPENPPTSGATERNVSAVLLDDGTIMYDTDAALHVEVINNLGIPPERVVDGGFIVGDQYVPGSADAPAIGRQAAARARADASRAARRAEAARGAAAPTPDPRIVSLRKEEGAQIRERLGLDELPSPARQSFQDAWDEASSRRLADQALDVAREAADSGRPLTAVEHTAAVQKYVELERELEASRGTLADAVQAGNDEVARLELAKSERLLDDIDALTTATDRTGTEAGRALSIRRLRANVNTYSLASGLQQARRTKGGSLTQDEIARVETLTHRVSELERQNATLQQENERLSAERARTVADAIVRIEARPRRSGAALQAERAALLEQLSKLGHRLNDVSGLSAEGLYLIGRLAVNRIRATAQTAGERVTLDRVVGEVLADLNNPAITARDIHGALNARDPRRVARQKTEATRQVAELKKQARLLVQIDAAERVRELRKHLTELRNSAYGSGMEAARLERVVAQINDLQDQLAPHRAPAEASAELQALRDKIQGLRQEMRTEDTLRDVEEQLRTGEFKLPEKRVPHYTSPGLEKNQIALRRARKEWRQEIEKLKPPSARRVIGETASTLRAIKATADMSGTLRQGFWLSARRPALAARTFVQSTRAFFSENTAEQIDNAIHEHPNQLLRDRAGLNLAEIGGVSSQREEYFASQVAERIPVLGPIIKASERSMTTTLNLLRVGAFDQFLDANPNATADELKAWASWVNIASGRGDIGRAAVVATELSVVVFAPRFAISRIQTPFQVFRYWQKPRVRAEIAKDYAAVAGVGLTALGLGALAGMAVGFDPREPDFGKMRFGDTRIDLWAGVQQPMRLLARIVIGATDRVGLTGEHLTDAERDTDPLELLGRFAAFKASPLVTLPLELYRGRTAVGEEVTPTQTAVRATLPLVVEDIYEAYRLSGPTAAGVTGTLQFVGVGASTYADSQSRVRRDIRKLILAGEEERAMERMREWNALNPDNRMRSVGDLRLPERFPRRPPEVAP